MRKTARSNPSFPSISVLARIGIVVARRETVELL
jgi:hypothetical protein